MSDRVEAFEINFERKLQERTHELAVRAITEPTAMEEEEWRSLNALFGLFYDRWEQARRLQPPSPITFGNPPSAAH